MLADERRDVRAVQAFQTIVTTSALAKAPPLVRSAAGYDQAAVLDGRVPTPAELKTQIAQISLGLGEALAGNTGAVVAQALTSTSGGPSGSAQGGNPVTRGVKSVGRGIKRLFGGGSSAVTDATGRFRFDHLSAGRYSATSQHSGQSSEPQAVVLTAGESKEDLVLVLEGGATL